MRENLHREITLTELAHSVNLSVWRLCHLFRSDVGMSPIKYLKLLRLEKAKHLLETSFLSVKEITYQVGINDDSHFVRDFKKTFGKAPTLYRAEKNERANASDNENPGVPIRAFHAKKSLAILFPTINVITYTVSIASLSYT